MIISRTPFRISFFGGGTDYPAWYLQNGGEVLGTSIDKYCYVSCRYLPPFFSHRIRVVYSAIELCTNFEEVKHPAVRETLRFFNWTQGLEIHHDADLPARAGIGSSSAFTVGLVNALNALRGQMTSKRDLMDNAIHIEQKMIRENVGSQDQVLTAQGGLCHVQFRHDGQIVVTPVTLPPNRMKQLESHLLLFFSGFSRMASAYAAQLIQNIPNKAEQLKTMRSLVKESLSILTGTSDLKDFGRLLHENWQIKRSLTQSISNSDIDTFYEKAQKAGALGGKLLGAGGGGFLVIFAEPEKHSAIRLALRNLLHVPFQFEHQGSSIIVYEPVPLAEAA